LHENAPKLFRSFAINHFGKTHMMVVRMPTNSIGIRVVAQAQQNTKGMQQYIERRAELTVQFLI
jgi:hypothetical protein